MTKVKYNGSLTDDINLINNHEDPSFFTQKNNRKAFFLLIGFNALCLVTSLLTGVVQFLGLTITMSSLGFTLYSSSIIRHNSNHVLDKFDAMSRISKLVLNFQDEDGKIILPMKDVTYESLINAVIVQKPEKEVIQVEQTQESSVEVDFENFYKIITSEIYFLDTSNKIRALREFKKVINFLPSGTTYTHEAELELLEDKDLPKPLPVKKVLELNDKSRN